MESVELTLFITESLIIIIIISYTDLAPLRVHVID